MLFLVLAGQAVQESLILGAGDRKNPKHRLRVAYHRLAGCMVFCSVVGYTIAVSFLARSGR